MIPGSSVKCHESAAPRLATQAGTFHRARERRFGDGRGESCLRTRRRVARAVEGMGLHSTTPPSSSPPSPLAKSAGLLERYARRAVSPGEPRRGAEVRVTPSAERRGRRLAEAPAPSPVRTGAAIERSTLLRDERRHYKNKRARLARGRPRPRAARASRAATRAASRVPPAVACRRPPTPTWSWRNAAATALRRRRRRRGGRRHSPPQTPAATAGVAAARRTRRCASRWTTPRAHARCGPKRALKEKTFSCCEVLGVANAARAARGARRRVRATLFLADHPGPLPIRGPHQR